ncbi:hypothetical protein M0802_014236 [Mischocyttarus mexicanus]|nr:hypothetical protein M0802_014236 [Mischocyttarus mexicanus]
MRRQQPGESSRTYIYSMQEIANQGNIEEDALIQYLADGLYDKLGRPRLYETTRRLAGFGKAITEPIGRWEVNIDIEGGIYTTDVFVVRQSDMSYEVLFGRELLKELDVRINKGRIEIRRPDERLSEGVSKGSVESSDYGHVGESEQFRWDISTVAYGCEVVFIRTAELVDNWIVYLRVISIVTSAQFNDKAVHSGDVSQIIYFSIAYVFLIVRFSRSVYSDTKPEH